MSQFGHAGDLYYRHSGRTPPARLLVALLMVLPAAAILAVVYGFAAAYLPKLSYAKLVMVFAELLVIGFGFGVGGLTGFMLKWARVRSVTTIAAVSLLAAAAAYYVSWVTWETIILSREVEVYPLRLAARPDAVWFLARAINETGTVVFGSAQTPINGSVLWGLWLAEAAIVLGIGSQVPVRMLRHLSYCEPCERWCDRHEGVVSVNYGDEAALRARLERRDFGALLDLGNADMDAARRFRVDLDQCPTCGNTNLLSVFRVDVSFEKGARQEKAVRVVDRLRVTAEEAHAVRDMRERLWAAQEAPASAAPQEDEEEDQSEDEGEEEEDSARREQRAEQHPAGDDVTCR